MIATTLEILDAETARRIRVILEGSEWEDGRKTAKGTTPEVKRNLQVVFSPAVKECHEIVFSALRQSRAFSAYFLPQQSTAPIFSRYEPGMHYGRHIDAPIMGSMRSDLSTTIFLSEPDSYEGGELVIDDMAPIKLGPGKAVVYPSTRIHEVTPVTSGVRYAAIFWSKSHVKDEAKRDLLRDAYDLSTWAEEKMPGTPEALRLNQLRANLIRIWAE